MSKLLLGLGVAKVPTEDYKIYAAKKDEMITRQVCVKAVAEIVKVRPDLVESFYSLCHDMEHYIHTGQDPIKRK